MPSLSELFGPQSDDNFNLDDFLREADTAVAASTADQIAQAGLTEPAPVAPGASTAPSSDPAQGAEAADIPAVDPPAPPAEPVAPPEPPAPVDPIASLSPERRAQLLALDEAMAADASVRERVVAAIAPPAPPAPSLPEGVDPESFEAHLWTQQQELLSAVRDMRGQQTRQTEYQRAAAAANEAGARFSARYQGQLTPEDVSAVATAAGKGVAGRFAAGADDLTAAYDQALEHVLWTTPDFRAKVLGVAPPATPDPAAVAAAQAASEAADRKRKLTALSSAASPVSGPAPARSPLEVRSDGRLTGDSRNKLIGELAGDLRRGSEGF